MKRWNGVTFGCKQSIVPKSMLLLNKGNDWPKSNQIQCQISEKFPNCTQNRLRNSYWRAWFPYQGSQPSSMLLTEVCSCNSCCLQSYFQTAPRRATNLVQFSQKEEWRFQKQYYMHFQSLFFLETNPQAIKHQEKLRGSLMSQISLREYWKGQDPRHDSNGPVGGKCVLISGAMFDPK